MNLLVRWPAEVTPTAMPVYPEQTNGFAAYIIGGFFLLAILVLFMVWTSTKPRSRRRPRDGAHLDIEP